jgi:hypothetical protein
MLNPANHAKVYDESFWAPVTWEDAMDPANTYRCSKVRASCPPETLEPHFILCSAPGSTVQRRMLAHTG